MTKINIEKRLCRILSSVRTRNRKQKTNYEACLVVEQLGGIDIINHFTFSKDESDDYFYKWSAEAVKRRYRSWKDIGQTRKIKKSSWYAWLKIVSNYKQTGRAQKEQNWERRFKKSQSVVCEIYNGYNFLK